MLLAPLPPPPTVCVSVCVFPQLQLDAMQCYLLYDIMVCFIPEPQFRVSSDQIKGRSEEEIQSGHPDSSQRSSRCVNVSQRMPDRR